MRVSVVLEGTAGRSASVGLRRYMGRRRLETGWEALRRSWERSVEDLGSLPFDAGEGLVVPAAGAPWYMALFGRDALIAGYQAMVLGPGDRPGTL